MATVTLTPDFLLYVSTTGNDSNDGSLENPLATIQAAVNKITIDWIACKQQKFISYIMMGEKSKIKVPAGLVSPEASQLAYKYQLTVSCMVFVLCLHIVDVSLLRRPPVLLD